MSDESAKKPVRSRRRSTQTAQSELIEQLKNNSLPMSKKATELAESNTSVESSEQSQLKNDPVFADKFSLENVILQRILPQQDNPRYLPIADTRSQHELIASATDCIVCDSGILENRLPADHPRFDEINHEIDEIKSLAVTIKREGLIHPITVWRQNTSAYPILAGHRRYYAVVYLYGQKSSIRCKVYFHKPDRVQIMRFIENNSRQDTSLSDTLKSYEFAVNELTQELTECGSNRDKVTLVRDALGISQAQYYRYSKFIHYKAQLRALFLSKVKLSITALYAALTEVEKANSGREVAAVGEWVTSLVNGEVQLGEKTVVAAPVAPSANAEPVKRKAGRARKFYTLPKFPVNKPEPLKRLISEGVASVECGVEWEQLDYSDPEAVQAALEQAINYLINQDD